MSVDSLVSTPVGNYILDELVAKRLTVRTLAELSETALYEFVSSAAAEASSAKWRVPSFRISPWDARATIAEVTALTDAVVRAPAAHWWASRALDRAQLWIGAHDATPAPGRMSPCHYGKPPNEIWTSSALDDGTSAWWPLLRAGPDSPPPTETQSVWRLTPNASAGVYEIHGPRDWASLCERFPGPDVDGFINPDWDAVAAEYDAVHLSVEGLIRAQGVAVESTRGVAMLDNWDAESTAWLRWCFEAVERVGELEPT